MNKKMEFKWCEPTTEREIRDIKTGIDQVLRQKYVVNVPVPEKGCRRWICHCRHDKGSHNIVDNKRYCIRCSCQNFEYLNNNNCDLECSINRKIYESYLV